jgi:geranylgeranylglycerol-phosphate geranylgeranyltransferase
VAVFLGAIMALERIPSGHLLHITILQALSVFSFMASWNALNDYFDYEIDKIGKPNRPLPSGVISLKDAKVVILCLMIISLFSISAAAFIASRSDDGFTSWAPSLIIWFTALLLLVNYESDSKYSLNLKNRGLPGNIAISASVAMVVLFGSAGVYEPTNSKVVSIAIIGFLYNLAREIIKDVEDMESDEGRNTLVMKIGPEKTRIVAYLISLSTFISILLPFGLDFFEQQYLILVMPSIIILLMVKTKLSLAQDYAAQQLLKKSLYLCLMAFAVISLI